MNNTQKCLFGTLFFSLNLIAACGQTATTSADRKSPGSSDLSARPTTVQPAPSQAVAASPAAPKTASKQPAIALTANTPGACIATELASPSNAPGAEASVFAADASGRAVTVDSVKLNALLTKCGISNVAPTNLALISKNFMDAFAASAPVVGSTSVTGGSTVNGTSTVSPGGNVTVNITNSVPQAAAALASSGSSSVVTSQSGYGQSLSLGYAGYSLFNLLGRFVGGVVALPFAAVDGTLTGVAQGLGGGLSYGSGLSSGYFGSSLFGGPTYAVTTTNTP